MTFLEESYYWKSGHIPKNKIHIILKVKTRAGLRGEPVRRLPKVSSEFSSIIKNIYNIRIS